MNIFYCMTIWGEFFSDFHLKLGEQHLLRKIMIKLKSIIELSSNWASFDEINFLSYQKNGAISLHLTCFCCFFQDNARFIQ